MPVDHYENFPVASWLLPARMRAPIEAIYSFARGADDIADEGDATPAERLAGLAAYASALGDIEAGRAPAAPFARIADAIERHRLPIELLRDLLDAFGQDVVKHRYATFAELRDYARRSANPIGRVVLHVASGPAAVGSAPVWSDAICTGLQLVNFWQDVQADWARGRVYIPQEDLARFGVGEEDIERETADARWAALMAFECERARALLRQGAPLGGQLPGRLGIEIRATVRGGLAIADKIDRVRGDVFRHRPVLRAADWARILVSALFERFPDSPAP